MRARAPGGGHRPLRLLTVARAQVHLWSEPETALVEAVARDVGRALQHGHLFEQQRQLVEQLRELDRAKSDFLSTVSHELRTPLTSISGYVELLRDEDAGPVTSQQEYMLDVIERNAGRLQALIEDLLTLSRIEANAFRISTVPLAVSDLVESASATVRPAMTQAGLALVVDVGPGGAQVAGDLGQLERVLLNLLSNAAKFSTEGGTVELSAQVEGREVVLTVTDAGIGIPEKEQEHLFARFFRGSNATARAIQGTGLGLTIVRSIVEHHGGRLVMRSREGRGTTVEVRLPLLPPGKPAGGMPRWERELEALVRSSGTLT